MSKKGPGIVTVPGTRLRLVTENNRHLDPAVDLYKTTGTSPPPGVGALQTAQANGASVMNAGEKTKAAFHEAGHLVASLLLGIPLAIACIEKSDEFPGQWVGRLWSDGPQQRRHPVTEANVEDRIVQRWAGPIAERVHVKGRHVLRPVPFELMIAFGGRDDIIKAEELATRFDVKGWKGRTQRKTVDLVRDHWDDISSWAQRLVEEESIDFDAAGTEALSADTFYTASGSSPPCQFHAYARNDGGGAIRGPS
jgi:hypothetical protein